MQKLKTIDQILDAKEVTCCYREQIYQSEKDVKLEVTFVIKKQRSQIELLCLLLTRLNEVIEGNGYIVKQPNNRNKSCYQIKLDPTSFSNMTYLFVKIKEIFDFSQTLLEIKNINLLFSRKNIIDYDRTHKRLLNFVLDQSEYFQENTIFIWNYQDYLNRQMDISQNFVTINYLKRKEIEIRNIKIDITPSELKNLTLGLLCEIYMNSYHFFEKRKIRSNYIRKQNISNLMAELSKNERRKETKLLVYTLDRRTPILVNVSDELEELLKEEVAKTLG